MNMLASGVVTVFILSLSSLHTESRSLHQIIQDSVTTGHTSTTTNSPILSPNDDNDHANMTNNTVQDSGVLIQDGANARVKRDTFSSSDGDCPVLPETGAFVEDDKHLSYFDFRWNEPEPSPPANQDLACPKSRYGTWWNQPHQEYNLKAACPWIYVYNSTSFHIPHLEVYPKYVKSAKCVCPNCILANKTMGCGEVWTQKVFYHKIGCKGDHPVFEKRSLDVKAGCFCTR